MMERERGFDFKIGSCYRGSVRWVGAERSRREKRDGNREFGSQEESEVE